MVTCSHLTHPSRPSIDNTCLDSWLAGHTDIFFFSPLCPQGKVTFPSGFTLEGSFSNGTDQGLRVQGVLDRAAHPPDSSSPHKR